MKPIECGPILEPLSIQPGYCVVSERQMVSKQTHHAARREVLISRKFSNFRGLHAGIGKVPRTSWLRCSLCQDPDAASYRARDFGGFCSRRVKTEVGIHLVLRHVL